MIPKYKMLKDILLEELLDSKIARASLPRISACTCLKMNVMVKYRNKMKKSCSAYAFHKRIIQKLVDNRYAQKCCSAYAFSQKARLNQIPNQHANISKSCNEARLSPLPVASVLDVFSYVWDRSDRKGDVFDFFRQSATQWTASVRTLHMSKPVITIIVNIVYITMRINRITDFPKMEDF